MDAVFQQSAYITKKGSENRTVTSFLCETPPSGQNFSRSKFEGVKISNNV
jgi:hypothetical protein